MSEAKQGHTYSHAGQRVLALQSGASVQVAVIEPGEPWIGLKYNAKAEWLEPLPMVYFHGETPQ